jgi:hypothetical protein
VGNIKKNLKRQAALMNTVMNLWVP